MTITCSNTNPVDQWCSWGAIAGGVSTTAMPGSVKLLVYKDTTQTAADRQDVNFYYRYDGDARHPAPANYALFGNMLGLGTGVVGYVQPAQQAGTAPLFGMRSTSSTTGSVTDDYLTSDPVYARANALKGWQGYSDQGVIGWLYSYTPSSFTAPTSWRYGGEDHAIDTPAEAQALGADLGSSGSSLSQLWWGLRTDDQAYMMSDSDDPTYGSWVGRVDTQPPGGVANLDTALDSTGTASVTWDPATDPNLVTGVQGAGVDHYNYQVQWGGGSLSATAQTIGPYFTATGHAAGTPLTVYIWAVDAAGNVGGMTVLSGTLASGTVTPGSPGGLAAGETGDADTGPDDGPPATEASVSYQEFLCGTSGPSPCNYQGNAYNSAAAVRYANQWWNGRNHHFPMLPSWDADCTNFASQMLWKGGLRFMRAHGINNPNDVQAVLDGKFMRGTDSWWAYEMPENASNMTQSWSVAYGLYHHLVDKTHIGRVIGSNEPVKPGDLIFYNWSGTNTSGIDHVQEVVKVGANTMWVTQHQPSYRHSYGYVLKYRIHSGDPGHVKGVDWQSWFVRPSYTAANIYG